MLNRVARKSVHTGSITYVYLDSNRLILSLTTDRLKRKGSESELLKSRTTCTIVTLKI